MSLLSVWIHGLQSMSLLEWNLASIAVPSNDLECHYRFDRYIVDRQFVLNRGNQNCPIPIASRAARGSVQQSFYDALSERISWYHACQRHRRNLVIVQCQ